MKHTYFNLRKSRINFFSTRVLAFFLEPLRRKYGRNIVVFPRVLFSWN